MEKTTSNLRKHTHWNPIQRLLIAYFYFLAFRILRRLRPNRILDAGCGEGITLEKLRQKGIGNLLEGVEYLQDAIDLGEKLYPKVKIKKGTIYSLPYSNNSFDTVLCTEVLEHLENPEKGLREILRVSSKYCLISVPNEPFFMLENLVRLKNVSRLGNDPDHRNHWNYFTFKKFLLSEKVRIVKYIAPLPLPLLIVLIEKTQY